MPVAQMRPTFWLETDMSAEDVLRRLRLSVVSGRDKYQGQFTSHHAMISIGESKRRFWSPWLNVEVRDDQPRRQIFCQFSPHPSLWTAFMFSYLSIGVLMFFAAICGMSQQLTHQFPWAYGVLPAGLFAAALLWLASKVGQRLAQAEMAEMKADIEGCINRQEHLKPSAPREE